LEFGPWFLRFWVCRWRYEVNGLGFGVNDFGVECVGLKGEGLRVKDRGLGVWELGFGGLGFRV
jgi:hypothetical protein